MDEVRCKKCGRLLFKISTKDELIHIEIKCSKSICGTINIFKDKPALLSEHKNLYGKKYSTRLRRAILKRDHYTCQYCGKKSKDLELDHVIPHSKGGKTKASNLVACCRDCNAKKGDNLETQKEVQNV